MRYSPSPFKSINTMMATQAVMVVAEMVEVMMMWQISQWHWCCSRDNRGNSDSNCDSIGDSNGKDSDQDGNSS